MTHETFVGKSVEWATPPSLLARFDDLPLTDVTPFRAGIFDDATHYHDALVDEWNGHVWCNPPYGASVPWFVDRMIKHGDGLLLLPSRTETRAFQKAARAADAVTFLRERLYFRRRDDLTGRAPFGSVLFAYGMECASALVKADLGWTVR